MNFSYLVLFIICLVAIGILLFNIVVAYRIQYVGFRQILIGLFTFSMLRYFTLIIYGDSPSLSQLESLKYLYNTTSIGLTIPTALVIWYITPHLRQKLSYITYLLYFSPWILFNAFIIISQPTEIVIAPNFGYVVRFVGEYNNYISHVQTTFVVIIILLCLVGIISYKNPILQSQYALILFGQVVLAFDGLRIVKGIETRLLNPFTVTEIIAFVAIYYALKEKPFDLKG
ncbi:hypothetical protein AN641_07240 [Candidatus Epulonipiscioides gigas]|nr:hypothetical protein AN641_07240 [Epulopiscium sp. SCG-C07WGA-EpuloA2]